MSGTLLFHRRSRPTGEVIADAIGAFTETGTHVHYSDWTIRWGSREPFPSNFHPGRVVNRAESIARASDKLGTLEILRGAGVRVPNWSINPEDLEYPFIGRRVHHARGTDIVLCLQRGDWTRNPRDYYVQYVPTVREFRIHVVAGEVIRVQGKFLDRPELAQPWVRNYGSGYRFRAPRRRLNGSRLEAAVASVEALGLDFGAVDLLIGDDNLEYVLEVNTAPACSPLTAAQYAGAFQRMLNIPSEEIDLSRLDLLSPEQEDGDTEDEVEGEGEEFVEEMTTDNERPTLPEYITYVRVER